ncbi:MAG TPA: radical SAM protein [Syntrophobacteria bacterium]|nr:radical SAM protein [Syntrophobacteria bacterium]
MRVVLISANTERINLPTMPLGLGYVAAAARRAGHEVALLDLMVEDDAETVVRAALKRLRPQVIGISVRNIDDQKMEGTRFLLEPVEMLIGVCRGLTEAPIVLGGAGYSIYPERALEYLDADMGIQGEGEAAFVMLLHRLERGADPSEIPGLYLRGRGLQRERTFERNLDSLPTPEDHLRTPPPEMTEDFWLPLQTRRGCPMGCSYCSTATIEGTVMRRRSPALVVQEMARLVARGYRRFYFVDNTFNLPVPHARDLCQEITASGLDIIWRCILYPWKVDEDLVRAMAGAGCREVSLGFESGNEEVLRAMNKRFNPDDVRRIARILGDYGVRRMGFLLLGGPGETRGSVEESLAFADSLALEAMKVTVGIRLYPHTALARTAVADGTISPTDNLFVPRFYLVREIEEWLPETAGRWLADRPNWMT